jgi:hypothetical protein
MGRVSSVAFARPMLESCGNRAAGEGNPEPAHRTQRIQTLTKDRGVLFLTPWKVREILRQRQPSNARL